MSTNSRPFRRWVNIYPDGCHGAILDRRSDARSCKTLSNGYRGTTVELLCIPLTGPKGKWDLMPVGELRRQAGRNRS